MMDPIKTGPLKATPWTQFGFPKRVRDWVGVMALTRREMHSGMMRVPAGTKVTIEATTHARSVRMESKPCSHCGVSARMSRVSFRDLEPIGWPQAFLDER